MITEKDVRLDYIPQKGELVYRSDNLDTLVGYVNREKEEEVFTYDSYIDDDSRSCRHKLSNGNFWKYVYPVGGYPEGAINNSANNLIKNIMSNFKSIIKNITRTEPNKTFIKAGFMDEEENLTSSGIEALQYVVMEKFSEELLTVAKQVVKFNEEK